MRIEITLSWYADAVEVRRVDDVERFTIGARPEDDLFVPLQLSEGGQGSHTLLARAHDGRLWLWPLDAAPQPLDERTDVSLGLGAFSVRVRAVGAEVMAPFTAPFDGLFANISTTTLAVTGALVALLVLAPHPVRAAPDALPSPRLTTWLRAVAPPLPVADHAWQAVQPPAADPTTGQPRRKQHQSGVRVPGDAALNAAFDALAVSSTTPGASIRAFEAALSGPSAHARGAPGQSGLAVRGGGVLLAEQTHRVGSLSSRLGEAVIGAGEAACAGCGGLRDDRDVTIAEPEKIRSIGPLDKELIRRVVRAHLAQIRSCYERALQSDASLSGKATIEWALAPDGNVTSARVVDSSLPVSVGACLSDNVRTWSFPAMPAGSDTALVRYPFVFRRG